MGKSTIHVPFSIAILRQISSQSPASAEEWSLAMKDILVDGKPLHAAQLDT